MCVTSLLCGQIYGPFIGFYVNGFLSLYIYIKVELRTKYFGRSLRKHRHLIVKRVHLLNNKPQESVTDEGARYLAEALIKRTVIAP